jgi:hypothetical protein
MEIDGKRYEADVIIYPDKIAANWWRKEGHNLKVEDIKDILNYKPAILVIGTGYNGVMQVSREVEEELQSKGIEFIAVETPKAVEIFNELAAKKKVVGAFHLTC